MFSQEVDGRDHDSDDSDDEGGAGGPSLQKAGVVSGLCERLASLLKSNSEYTQAASELFAGFGFPDTRKVERSIGRRAANSYTKLAKAGKGLLAMAGQSPTFDQYR